MKFSKTIALIVTLLTSSAAFAAAPSSWIGQIQGDVKVDGHIAKNGAAIKSGSRIQTGDGTASLFLAGNALAHVGKNSDVLASSLVGNSDQQIKLNTGKLRALVRGTQGTKKNNFQIHTKTAVMGVRGTHIVVDSPASGQPNFLVLEGQAEVTVMNGPTVPLGALQKFEVGASAPTTVTAQQAQAEAESVAPTDAAFDTEAASDTPEEESSEEATEESPEEAKEEADSAFEDASSAFDAIDATLVVPLDPIADSPTATLRVKFNF